MKTKYGIFAGLFVLVAMIGMSPSFADSNTTVLSTNDGVQLTKTVVPMSIPSDNTMPWGFIEGTVENHAEGYPVILQILPLSIRQEKQLEMERFQMMK